MNLYYLDKAQTEALQANGFKLDGTDNLKYFQATIRDDLGYDEFNLVMKRTAFIMNLPTLKRMTGERNTEMKDIRKEFSECFPEHVSGGLCTLMEHIEKCSFIGTQDGDVIVCDTEGVDQGDFAEMALKALSTQMDLNDVLKTPLWSYIEGVR